MDWPKTLIPVLIAVVGWIVGHHFHSKRDRDNKLRDLRIQFLLDAYRRLEFAANRPEAAKNEQDNFESAIADIQLLGTKRQIEELMNYVDELNSKNCRASINPLLTTLRLHLRQELDLEKDIPEIKIFRFENRLPESPHQKQQ